MGGGVVLSGEAPLLTDDRSHHRIGSLEDWQIYNLGRCSPS